MYTGRPVRASFVMLEALDNISQHNQETKDNPGLFWSQWSGGREVVISQSEAISCCLQVRAGGGCRGVGIRVSYYCGRS